MVLKSSILRAGAYSIIVTVLYIVLGTITVRGAAIDNSILQICIMFGGEGFLLSIPVWLFCGRLRVLSPLLLWIAALFMAANVLYARYWGDFIPLSLIFNPDSYNGIVAKAVLPLLQPADLLWIALPLAGSLAYRCLNVSKLLLPQPCRFAVPLICLVAFALSVTAITIQAQRYFRNRNIERSFLQQLSERIAPASSTKGMLHSNALILFISAQIKNMGNRSLSLDQNGRTALNKFAETLKKARQKPSECFDTNRNKNLIFIVVESLNSWDDTPYRIGGKSIIPTLDSIIDAPGTVSCLKVKPQIKGGGSSDGQFIYNTGLLPAASGATALDYASNSYPSLPRAMGYKNSFEVIQEQPFVWNHTATSKSYGYARLYADFDTEGRSMDRTVFDAATDIIARSEQPFTAFITTMSMHFPFNDPGVPEIISADDEPDPLHRRYLNALAHFDTELGRFLCKLNALGILENSVVILASDHDQNTRQTELDNPENNRQNIVFIAAGTSKTLHIDRPAVQSDVFATTLEIMGRGNNPWQGVGQSMIHHKTPVDEHRIETASDSIIRAAYFPV